MTPPVLELFLDRALMLAMQQSIDGVEDDRPPLLARDVAEHCPHLTLGRERCRRLNRRREEVAVRRCINVAVRALARAGVERVAHAYLAAPHVPWLSRAR